MRIPGEGSDTEGIMNGTIQSNTGPESLIPNSKIFNESITNKYKVLEEIGRGKFAVVRKCSHIDSGKVVAAKFIRKRRKGKSARESILREVKMLEFALAHPRLVDLLEVFETPQEIVVVTEYCSGGELFYECVIEESFKESDVVHLVHQILDGLIYLHDRNIVHLDLKPQNILLTKPFPEGTIKLCDFGFACLLNSGKEIREILGTPDYVAPEVLNYEPISLATDIWSLGVLTYVMLTACSPFTGKSQQETFMNITLGKLDFPEELFSETSSHAKEFITSLLVQDPRKRLTAKQCMEHHWLRGENYAKSIPAQMSSCKLDVTFEVDLGEMNGPRVGHIHVQAISNKRHKYNGTLTDLPPPGVHSEDEGKEKNSENGLVELKSVMSNGNAKFSVHNSEVDKENLPISHLSDRLTDKHTDNPSAEDKTEVDPDPI